MNELQEKPVWYTLLIVIISGAIGLVFGYSIGALAGSFVYRGPGNFFEVAQNIKDSSLAIPLLITQGIASIFSFLIFPLVAWSLIRRKKFNYFNNQIFYLLSIPLVIGIVLSFDVANSAAIQWNEGIHLPEFLKPRFCLRVNALHAQA